MMIMMMMIYIYIYINGLIFQKILLVSSAEVGPFLYVHVCENILGCE